ncbi:MAG: MFS transporter, partial [Halobacteria archaeon]|nr:MFS transporter [Halobacteria archaeon]
GMFGWRSSVFGVGLIGIGVALALYATVRRNPEKAGLRPIEGVISPPDVSVSDVLTNTKTVLKERETWLMGILLFFTLGANFTVLGLWGVPYIVDLYGVSVTQASTYVLLGNLGLVVGPPIVGWVSDRLGMRTELIVGASLIFTLAYGVIALTGVPPLFVVGIAFFVVMFLVGGFALTYTVVKELHPAEASGTATGTINSIGYFGAAILPAVMGAVLDVFWTGETVAGARVYSLLGYRVAFSIATACGVIALVCSVWLHFRTER